MSVYFARSGIYTKIGYSKDPIARATTVTTHGARPDDVARGADVTLMGWVPGDRKREAEFHRAFASTSVAGEWFDVDEATVRGLLWDDPRGVDVQRMSALAVFAMLRSPNVTRAELDAAGVPVEAPPLEVSRAAFDAALAACLEGVTR